MKYGALIPHFHHCCLCVVLLNGVQFSLAWPPKQLTHTHEAQKQIERWNCVIKFLPKTHKRDHHHPAVYHCCHKEEQRGLRCKCCWVLLVVQQLCNWVEITHDGRAHCEKFVKSQAFSEKLFKPIFCLIWTIWKKLKVKNSKLNQKNLKNSRKN